MSTTMKTSASYTESPYKRKAHLEGRTPLYSISHKEYASGGQKVKEVINE